VESELARTLEELKKLKDDARKAKNSADEAVKKLTDVSVPKELHKSRKRFLGRLRDFIKHQAKKIKVLDKAMEAARKRKKEGGADDAVKWA
jgi:GTP1/Obg family GTP-binding protein